MKFEQIWSSAGQRDELLDTLFATLETKPDSFFPDVSASARLSQLIPGSASNVGVSQEGKSVRVFHTNSNLPSFKVTAKTFMEAKRGAVLASKLLRETYA